MDRAVVFGLIAIYFTTGQGFVLDDLLGHGTLGRCQTDADCSGGCCLSVVGALFNHNECKPYHLPGATCDVSATVNKMVCGCMPGYQCEGPAMGNVALEPTTHLKGACMPVNGTATGPQIAVEGGR